MPPPSIARAAAAAALALQLLRVWSAEECLRPGDAAAGSGIFQQHRRSNDWATMLPDSPPGLSTSPRHSRMGLSLPVRTLWTLPTNTSFCRQLVGLANLSNVTNCWESKPPLGTPLCTALSGNVTCRCNESSCNVNALESADPPTTGRCAIKDIYVPHGWLLNDSSSSLDLSGDGVEIFCRDMLRNDQWKGKHLLKLPQDSLPVNSHSYWGCWWPNTWQDGKCQRTTRYLGESCWGGWWGSGVCAGNDIFFDEYSTACYKGKCTPSAWVNDLKECSCFGRGQEFVIACRAMGGQCSGHACVRSEHGKRYCDYGSSQNW